MAYSLWLMPTEAVDRKFSQIISQLAEQYSLTVFPPHVTLIASIEAHEEEAIIKAQEVALLIRPYIIQLANVDYMDSYYRSLFIRVEPSEYVLAAYQTARKIFPSNQETGYLPHLSLLYGDISVGMKKQIIQKIGDNFTDKFEANTLHLYRTGDTVSDWQRISALPLQA